MTELVMTKWYYPCHLWPHKAAWHPAEQSQQSNDLANQTEKAMKTDASSYQALVAQQSSCVPLARAVAIGALAYGAPAYDFSKTNLKSLRTLHRATLRTITCLPRHTRITALEQAAPLPSPYLIMKLTRMQADSKRALTLQGLAL